MDRLLELERLTKDYFIESHEFLYTKKFISKRKKTVNLIFSAYNLEYNLILKDYKIFFDNKLKTKFKINTNLVQERRKKVYNITKYYLASKVLNFDKFFDRNFNLKDITIRPNALISFKVSRRSKTLYVRRLKVKKLNKLFFYEKALETL